MLARKIDRTQECLGCSSGGMTTKIHATCDVIGNITGFYLSLGHVHDVGCANVFQEDLLNQIQALLADKAYAAKARLLDRLEQC